MKVKVGLGVDFHKFEEGRELFLGGIKIDYPLGLAGHSDADCLIHSIMDALLGAVGEDDIGKHFPDNDKSFKNIDSKILLERVVDLVKTRGFKISNIDCTVICEEPKIRNYVNKMKKTLSKILFIPEDDINIKGTTTEKMGFAGRKEGIACMATALIYKNGD
ncbi:MAG: 2-C-methyl-D-erythritol 2,4-cyclodiphosphate synthase [Proteobacteria bacterium]|nr:2-C-methyl-D-erythritol 2,4-cyclodiphosphate synthase [Pseudomonadota bacterium]